MNKLCPMPGCRVEQITREVPGILSITAKGRVKARNMQEGARVALAIMDPENPYRYVQVRGRVKRIIEVHGGAIRVQGGKGMEWTVQLTLPLAQPATERRAIAHRAAGAH